MLSALVCGVLFAKAAVDCPETDISAVSAAVRGGRVKKHIGLLFDVMRTTPTNILANADKFAKHAPYLDGIAIALSDIPVVDADGKALTVNHASIMNGSQRWSREALEHHVSVLKAIAAKKGLSESFLLFWITPKTYKDRLDWADDKAWANFAANMAVVASLARDGGMKGLMLDPEEYASGRQYHHTPADPPFAQTAKLARQRGREVFSRVFKEFPDAVIFTLWYFGAFRNQTDKINPVGYADENGELLPYFYNGMLDVMPPGIRVVDGCEHYSLSATRYQYLSNANAVSTGVLAFVAPENHVKYRSQVYVGNTHFLDMFTQEANPKSWWYHGPVDGSRLEHFRRNLQQSLDTATEYVWIYAENSGKLFDWSDGNFKDRKTWEEVIPGMTETIMLVKDPLRWAAMRRAELAADGNLANLAPDAESVKFENPAAERSYSQSDSKMPSVKGVKPGERYLVSVLVRTSTGRDEPGRHAAASPRVIWRSNGKRIDAKPVYLDVPTGVCTNLVKAECVATVPEGADELLFDLAGKLKADESVHYRHPAICNALDPVDIGKDVSSSKWKLDLKKRTLTDGHWVLGATIRKDRLFVDGNGAKTVGGGVLDLRNVKRDTGYDIFELNRFGGYEGITALVAPDVHSIAMRAFKDCVNLRGAVVGNLSIVYKGVETANDRRRDNLSRLGVRKELIDGRTRVGFKHPSTIRKSFGSKISVKGVKPGELYNLALSMKRSGAGSVRLAARCKAKGRFVGLAQNLAMKGPREDGVWREGEAVIRVPAGADEVCFDVTAVLNEGSDTFEFKDFRIYKIGDPLPVWPEEFEREKGR